MSHEHIASPTPTDLGQPQQPVIDYGEQLGLPDGQFLVERNIYDESDPDNRKIIGKQVEQGGWAVTDVREVQGKDGVMRQIAQITEGATGAYKHIPVEKLYSWQPKSEQVDDDKDRTLTRAEIAALKAGKAVGKVAAAAERPERISRFDERRAKIFAPLPEQDETGQNDFEDDDHIANMLDPSFDWDNKSTEYAANRKADVGRKPNEDSISYAEQMLISPGLDPVIKGIISRGTYTATTPTEKAAMIRSDVELREELAEYMLTKVYMLNDLPARVSGNQDKSPTHKGYEHLPKMTGKEYASLLALSMLDGTFKPNHGSVEDNIRTDENGKVLIGQHRYAAASILFDRY